MFRTAVRLLGLALFVGGVASFWPAQPQAETEACTQIMALPATISAPGIYCLKSNLSYASAMGNAITINSSNVVLDFNGFFITNASAGLGTTAFGVFFVERRNVTIRNGSILEFFRGIHFQGTSTHGVLIEQMRTNVRSVGIAGESLGTSASGVIRDNQVNRTGGTTAFGPGVDQIGIKLQGGQFEVADNFVLQVSPVSGSTGYGIHTTGSINHVVSNNRVITANVGIRLDPGAGQYRDNITSNVGTPYMGGINRGNNF